MSLIPHHRKQGCIFTKKKNKVIESKSNKTFTIWDIAMKNVESFVYLVGRVSRAEDVE